MYLAVDAERYGASLGGRSDIDRRSAEVSSFGARSESSGSPVIYSRRLTIAICTHRKPGSLKIHHIREPLIKHS